MTVMVADTKPLRQELRRQGRAAILDAARDLTVARGWGEVRMADVAAAAGVSRRTVYNEFENRDRLAEAMVQRELETFVRGIRRILDTAEGDLRDAVEEAVRFALDQAAASPLVKAALAGAHGGPDSLLPYLTTDAELVLETAIRLIVDYARRRMPHLPADRVAVGAEVLARTVVSNIVLPLAPSDQVAADLADVVIRYISSVADD